MLFCCGWDRGSVIWNNFLRHLLGLCGCGAERFGVRNVTLDNVGTFMSTRQLFEIRLFKPPIACELYKVVLHQVASKKKQRINPFKTWRDLWVWTTLACWPSLFRVRPHPCAAPRRVPGSAPAIGSRWPRCPRRAHCSTSRCLFAAAPVHVHSFHGHRSRAPKKKYRENFTTRARHGSSRRLPCRYQTLASGSLDLGSPEIGVRRPRC